MAQPTTETRQGPPLPKWVYKIVNPFMMAVLRSPLHSPISNAMMILIYEGRKSGKRYMIPVGYLEAGNRVYLFSHSGWAKNFVHDSPVAMRLRGELVAGIARVTEDPATIEKIVQRMVAERGEAMAQRMGFVRPGPDGSLQQHAPKGTTFIEIERVP